MENKNNDFKKLSGAEKILFCKMIKNAQHINQNGSACSYKENMDFYDSIKNVTTMLGKHGMTFDHKKVLGIE